MTTWSEEDIREYIESHDDDAQHDEADLLDMFRSIYSREPDDDERRDMWSHICAGVSHQ